MCPVKKYKIWVYDIRSGPIVVAHLPGGKKYHVLMLNFSPLFLTELNNQIKIQTTQTPETVKGHGCDRCEQESHLLGIMYKMELMG